MRFESPIYLLFLAIIPLLFLLRWVLLMQKRKKMLKWGDEAMMRQQMPDVSRYRPLVKFSLLMTILALLIVMLARPQMGTKVSNEKRNGIEAIICLDISNSMMANDVTPSRLDKSKLMVQNLVEHFTNDKVGLVVFAGDAFTQLPITSDYISAKMFLQNAVPELIQEQGTDIGKAINIAMQSFTKQEKIGRAIIIITDGENHEEGTLEAAKEASKQGMQVFVLGVGSASGSKIPLADGSVMKDNSGNDVITKLNEDMCKEIAKTGKGTYIHVDNTGDAQKKLDEALANMQRSEVTNVIYSEYGEQFQVVGVIVILLLIIELLIMERKTSLQKRVSLFRRKGATVLLLLMLMPLTAIAQNSDRDHIRRGNHYYRSGKINKAIGEYQKAIGKNADNAIAHYNYGCAQMAYADKHDGVKDKLTADSIAIDALLKSIKLSDNNRNRKAKAYHNIGVTYQKHYYYFNEIEKGRAQGQVDEKTKQAAANDKIKALEEAVKSYRQSLRNNPKDDQTRFNLAVCQYLLKKNKNNQNQNQNQNQQNQDKQKDQKDKQDKQQQNKNQEQQKQQQQPQQQQMSKENAEQMLDAANRQEQQIQQRMRRGKPGAKSSGREKNW